MTAGELLAWLAATAPPTDIDHAILIVVRNDPDTLRQITEAWSTENMPLDSQTAALVTALAGAWGFQREET